MAVVGERICRMPWEGSALSVKRGDLLVVAVLGSERTDR
jgi:hypothetical protein